MTNPIGRIKELRETLRENVGKIVRVDFLPDSKLTGARLIGKISRDRSGVFRLETATSTYWLRLSDVAAVTP